MSDSTNSETINDLEEKYGCPICYQLPQSHIYQCVNKHNLCLSCVRKLDDYAVIENRPVHCPYCRVLMTPDTINRNFCMEAYLSVITLGCGICGKQILATHLKEHQETECLERIVACNSRFPSICRWTGPESKRFRHEIKCIISYQIRTARSNLNAYLSTLWDEIVVDPHYSFYPTQVKNFLRNNSNLF